MACYTRQFAELVHVNLFILRQLIIPVHLFTGTLFIESENWCALESRP